MSEYCVTETERKMAGLFLNGLCLLAFFSVIAIIAVLSKRKQERKEDKEAG